MQAQQAVLRRDPALPVRRESDELNLIGQTRRYGRDQEIYGEGEGADFVYKLISGAVRGFKVLADGRRQVLEFYLPGDIFGLEAGPVRKAAAEAVGEVQVIVARRSSILAEDGAGLWRVVIRDLLRSQEHILTLGRRAAAERVASFLVDLADRTGADEVLELPCSRQDIADYLGLTIETVSRTFTQLSAQGLIDVHCCRSVRLANRRALEDLCE